MAKINVRIPEPKEDYDFSNQKQINRTFLDELKQEQERFSWFVSG